VVDNNFGQPITYSGDIWQFTTTSLKAVVVFPDDGATDVARNAVLQWDPGFGAEEHDVYLGTDQELVANGDPSVYMGRQKESFFDPDLDWGTRYFWRVDEIVAGEDPPERGDVWSFTTTNPIGVVDSGETPLYDMFELELTVPGVSGSKFTRFVSATFSRGERSFAVEGFYDGDDTWRVRFMPDEQGIWNYEWTFEGQSGSGSFVCTAQENAKAHGHVHVDPSNRRYLVHDDGTAHYWYGGKWISALNYGPSSKGGQSNPGRISDSQFISYLDDMETYKHNGLLAKTSLFPLENDKLSWDLTWIRRLDWLVQEMGKRGIYCQVNLFSTWSRIPGSWFGCDTNGSNHVFNVWASGDEAAKENYIRYMVARFAGYYNVYFELGNEMEHSPNSGSAFAAQANSKYIPWYRNYDPYGLPIGLSETSVARLTDVDIVFTHQTTTSSMPPVTATKPWIMNVLVRGWEGGRLWRDDVIRSSGNRLGYRRTFWRMFTRGGAGTGEATWLDITYPLNSAVYDVMGDQMRLRSLVEDLPVHINSMDTDAGFVVSGPGEYRTRRLVGQCYVTYFLGSSAGGNVTVNLPAGDYVCRWYDPSTGIYSNETSFSHGGGSKTISHPSFSEDIVLVIVRDRVFVDWKLYAVLARHWLVGVKAGSCHSGNDYCDRADSDYDGDVDMRDLLYMVEHWLDWR